MATEIPTFPHRPGPLVALDPEPVPEGHCGCGKLLSPGATRCRDCRASDLNEFTERVEAMLAQRMTVREVAEALGVSRKRVRAAKRRAELIGMPHQRSAR